MRAIKYIIIHEAACPLLKPSGAEFTIADIDNWHLERGFKRIAPWRNVWHPELMAVGYHYVIGVKGQIYEGRHHDEVPAAVKGFNASSINICLIGQGKYTRQQWMALKTLIESLSSLFTDAIITGHYNKKFNSGKTCPDFNVEAWLASNKAIPDEGLGVATA